MKSSLASAREHMSTQSQSLLDAQQRVDELLSMQQKLRTLLGGGLPPLGEENTAPVPTAKGGGGSLANDEKLGEMRTLLGQAVRAQTEQQHEIDSLRQALREEQTASQIAVAQATSSRTDMQDARKKLEEVQAQLKAEQSERMESEAAAMEREETLQAKVEELEEAERRRLELEKAFEAVDSTPTPPAASISVATPPPKPPAPAGFDISAGGFSL
jgi:hypothetical protein